METRIYTPAQFVKEWLPNYNEREKYFFSKIQHVSEIGFTDFAFSDALGAFAESQREECQLIMDNFIEKGNKKDDNIMRRCKELYNKRAILFAPTPQPKNAKQ